MTKQAIVFVLLLWVSVRCAWAAGDAPGTTSSTLRIGLVQANEWGQVHAQVKNPTDTPLSAWVVTGFDAAAEIQFATPVWVPGHATRGVEVPVHAPAMAGGGGAVSGGRGERAAAAFAVPTMTLLLVKSENGEERQLAREPGLLVENRRNLQIAVVQELEDASTPELVRALLGGNTSRAAVSYFAADHLPTMVEGLAPFKVIVFAASAKHADAAQRQALRRWLTEGGHLVMLATMVSQEDALLLLGDDWPIEPVSRTELDDFRVEPTGDRQLIQLASPGEMVRVLAPGMTVVASINGWPAELQRTVGAGELTVVTTSPEVFFPMGYRGNNAGQHLESDVMPGAAEGVGGVMASAKTADVLSDLAAQQVSYTIVSRTVVLEILGAFVLAVGLVGVVLAARQRLEWIAGVGIVFAIAATGMLIVIGSAHPLPLTMASAQYASYVPGQRSILARGQVQVFSPKATDGEIYSTTGGEFWPDLSTQGGSLVRLVRDDVDAFHWENLHLPAGAALGASVYNVIPVSSPVAVTGMFGAAGLQLNCATGALGNFSDSVLLAPQGNLSPAVAADGSLLCDQASELPAGTYLNGSLLTERQRQRQIAYRTLLEQRPLVESPTLLAWSNSDVVAAGGVSLKGHPNTHATTLVELPVEIRHSEPHTAIALPSAFVPFTLVRGADGMAPAYSTSSGQWIPNLTTGAALHFRFHLPEQVLPLHVEKAILHLALRAPGRSVEVVSMADHGEQVLDARSGPVAPYDIALPTEDAQPDGNGFMYVTVRVGSVTDTLRTWDVQSILMDVQGTTLASDAGPSSPR